VTLKVFAIDQAFRFVGLWGYYPSKQVKKSITAVELQLTLV